MDNKEYPPAYSEKPPPPQIGFSAQPVQPQQAYSPYPPQQGDPNAPPMQQPLMQQQQQQPVIIQQQPMYQPGVQPMLIQSSGGTCHAGPAVITTMPIIGSESCRMKCPHCQSDIDTSTTKSPTILAMISALGLFMLGCVCGCCLIPLCLDDCKSVEHACPSCRRFLGKYQKY